jgi:hypothetical protein
MGGDFLPPWLLQVFGLLIIAVFVVVKVTTGQESPLLVGAGVTLATLGGLQGGWQRLKRDLYKGNPPEEQDKGGL